MINIFKKSTSAKDIELFELKVIELIKEELPEIEEHLWTGKLKIHFSKTGILLVRKSFIKANAETVKKSKFNFFELSGIYLIEKKTQTEKEIKLIYQSNNLREIKIEKPETFYKDFDFNSVAKKEISIRNIELENPDLETVSKILSSLRKEQLARLDLDGTFEIEINEKSYYPIVDMESGNYIAVDKKGKIYKLNHEAKEDVKEIFENAQDFFNVYKGVKLNLEVYFE